MTNLPTWQSADAQAYLARYSQKFEAMSFDELDAEAHQLIKHHERYLDHECINLYAGTNIMNPRAAAMLSSTIGSRPNLGHAGDKYNKGMQYAEQLEVMLTTLLQRLFGVPYVEYRVGSGSLANLYAYMATCKPGDTIMAFSDAAAGHPTHHAVGAAGLYGLDVREMPFDNANMDVDVSAFATQARAIKPKLIIVAGSMCLFPYSVSAVREIADEVGAWVMYDAAHMGGMIVGGQFQQPLREGAHIMTGSTYKSFGGPPSGFIATTSATLAERLDKIAFPGLTANFDLSRTAAMIIAVLDLLQFGEAYAKQCIANAQALAQALHVRDVPVFRVANKGFTASQHVAIEAVTLGGGNAASKLMERANVLLTSIGLPIASVAGDANGIRIGTQEITRWGMREEDMDTLAKFVARVFVRRELPEDVRRDVIAFRSQFQTLHFVRV